MVLIFLFPEILDGKEISETSRQFLRNWHASKEVQKKKREEIYRKGNVGDFLDGITYNIEYTTNKQNYSYIHSL